MGAGHPDPGLSQRSRDRWVQVISPFLSPSGWAKLSRNCLRNLGAACRQRCSCETRSYLSLVGHSADVAAALKALLRRPVINARLAALLGKSALSAQETACLLALAALHDLGKINVGFQFKPFEVAGADAKTPPSAGHIRPLFDLLRDGDARPTALRRKLMEEGGLGRFAHLVRGRNDGSVSTIFRAVLAHHGRIDVERKAVDSRLWQRWQDYEPLAACRALTDAVAAWFPAACENGPTEWPAPFCHAFAGLVSLADWLGSDASRFPLTGGDAPDGHERLSWACKEAARLLEDRLLSPERARTSAIAAPWNAASLIGFPAMTPAQAVIAGLPPPPADGRLCLIEDETGAGKTEAALIHFLQLFRDGHVDGLYFALPTRAAAAQIRSRIQARVSALLGAQAPPVLLAVPGYVPAQKTSEGPVPPLSDPATLFPDTTEDLRRDELWAAERPNRYLAGCIVVGTVDQVLMGGLRVKHAQLRSAAMLRLLLVVDEVHASDPYMSVILRNLLAQHRRAGGHALLMSATLGACARQRYFQLQGRLAVPPLAEAIATDYPRIWMSDLPPPELSTTERRSKDIDISLLEEWRSVDAVVTQAVTSARAGAEVLVIRNTVRLAVETELALEAYAAEFVLNVECPMGGSVPVPHHARYAPEDRARLDRALEARLGKDAARPGGSITVATQTAEQSLDIDADLLITDLCPADVLLQRLGRLHRHQRARPAGFERAKALVVAPDEASLTASIGVRGEVRNGPLALGLVYADLLGVLATRRELASRGVVRVPRDNRALVEAATHKVALQELSAELGGPWRAHHQAVWGKCLSEQGQADVAMIDWAKPIESLNDQEVLRTRLGLDDRVVPLPEGTMGPFGTRVSGLTIPGRWLVGAGADVVPVVARAGAAAISLRLGERAFLYDRLGLRQAPS
jgi:CRISPR-associated endonuclease/helicase Cas3